MVKKDNEIKVAFFDIDGTLYRDNISLRLVEVLRERGHIEAKHCVDFDAVQGARQAREASYEDLMAELSKLTETAFTGLHLDDLITAGAIAAEHGRDRPYVFTRALLESLKTMRRRPHLVAISGSPIAVVEPYCKALGFDEVYATYFKLDDSRVTGGFSQAESPYHHKDRVCRAVADQLKLTTTSKGTIMGALAVGDALADGRMLEVVEYPVAFNPTAALRIESRSKGFPCVTERKDAITVECVPWPKAGAAMHEVAIESILPSRLAKWVRERIPQLYQPA